MPNTDLQDASDRWKAFIQSKGVIDLNDDDALVKRIGKILCGIGVDSTNRAEVMLNLTAFAFSDKVFWNVFHENWSGCDDTWHLREELIGTLTANVDSASEYWRNDQRRFFDDLPKMVTLYRGCSLDRIHGMSWTTNRKVAEGFARGHRGMRVPDAVIAKTRIRKTDIITVVTDRGESEVIIDPDQIGFEASFERYVPVQEVA